MRHTDVSSFPQFPSLGPTLELEEHRKRRKKADGKCQEYVTSMSNYHPVSGMGERSRQSRLVSIVPCLPEREGCPGRVTDFFRLPQRVPLLEEGKRQQNPSVLNQRFRDAALMGQLAVFLFLWLFFAVFLTHGRKQAVNPAPPGRIWNTLVYLLAGTASAVELKVGLFLLIIVALLLPLKPVSAFFHPCVRAGPGESGAP